MATLNLFPARVRFTNADGTLTPEAYRTLQVLSQRVGGTLGDSGRDVFGDITGVAALDLSIMDAVTQPTTAPTLADMVQQPVGVADFMPDVVQPPNEAVSFDLAAAIHAAPSKTTPVDADEMPLADSEATFKLKRLTWAGLKATLAAWINANLIPGSFTTLSASGDFTVNTNRVSFSALAPEGSLTLASSGCLALGATPSSWASFYKGFDVSTYCCVYGATTNNAGLINNGFFNGASWIYRNTAAASNYSQSGGVHSWATAPAGTAGNSIDFAEKMNLSSSGLSVSVSLTIGSYTNATRPAHAAGKLIYVSDGGAGANFQGSNGSAWLNLG